ncbi:MAG: hypothetical protein RIQ60_907 [Pseudomonadota bacterium]
MFAISSRPVLKSSLVRNGQAPIGLIDAMLSDWMSPATTSEVGSQRVLRARVDLIETETGYELRAELPGVRKQDIEIDVDGCQVSVSARLVTDGERKDGSRVLYSERGQQAFQRSIELPHPVDAARCVARFEDGVLTLDLPRLAPAQGRRVTIS